MYFTLLHYYNKKRVEWYMSYKNNIIYLKYIIIIYPCIP